MTQELRAFSQPFVTTSMPGDIGDCACSEPMALCKQHQFWKARHRAVFVHDLTYDTSRNKARETGTSLQATAPQIDKAIDSLELATRFMQRRIKFWSAIAAFGAKRTWGEATACVGPTRMTQPGHLGFWRM